MMMIMKADCMQSFPSDYEDKLVESAVQCNHPHANEWGGHTSRWKNSVCEVAKYEEDMQFVKSDLNVSTAK